tara:strand:- start:178 stop:804 length:627 start_codon:yes stop_codon:yes gene_type:complete
MGKVYVIRKQKSPVSAQITPTGYTPQIELDTQGPLTDTERYRLGRFGRIGSNIGRLAKPFAAAYSALSNFADDNQGDGLSALGRAGLAGYTTAGLMSPAERYLARAGTYLDNYGKPRQVQSRLTEFNQSTAPPAEPTLGDFSNTTGPASPSPDSPSMVGIQETRDKALRNATVEAQAKAQADANKKATEKQNATITTLSENQKQIQGG